MCYDRYTRRQHEEAESRRIWQEFEGPRYVSDPQAPDIAEPEVTEPEVTEPERAEEPVPSGP